MSGQQHGPRPCRPVGSGRRSAPPFDPGCRAAGLRPRPDVRGPRSPLQIVSQRRKLPPVLNDRSLFTRASPYGNKDDPFYHSPSNRIGGNYSPHAQHAASILFEEFPQASPPAANHAHPPTPRLHGARSSPTSAPHPTKRSLNPSQLRPRRTRWRPARAASPCRRCKPSSQHTLAAGRSAPRPRCRRSMARAAMASTPWRTQPAPAAAPSRQRRSGSQRQDGARVTRSWCRRRARVRAGGRAGGPVECGLRRRRAAGFGAPPKCSLAAPWMSLRKQPRMGVDGGRHGGGVSSVLCAGKGLAAEAAGCSPAVCPQPRRTSRWTSCGTPSCATTITSRSVVAAAGWNAQWRGRAQGHSGATARQAWRGSAMGGAEVGGQGSAAATVEAEAAEAAEAVAAAALLHEW
jgi:hypothetical protein